MIDLVVLIVGVIVFSITVYGAVMGAGLALTREQLREDESLRKNVDMDQLDRPLPAVKY